MSYPTMSGVKKGGANHTDRHRDAEKRHRERIGASIAQIASLLPDVGPADQRPVILEKAILFIRKALEVCPDLSRWRSSSEPSSVHAARAASAAAASSSRARIVPISSSATAAVDDEEDGMDDIPIDAPRSSSSSRTRNSNAKQHGRLDRFSAAAVASDLAGLGRRRNSQASPSPGHGSAAAGGGSGSGGRSKKRALDDEEAGAEDEIDAGPEGVVHNLSMSSAASGSSAKSKGAKRQRRDSASASGAADGEYAEDLVPSPGGRDSAAVSPAVGSSSAARRPGAAAGSSPSPHGGGIAMTPDRDGLPTAVSPEAVAAMEATGMMMSGTDVSELAMIVNNAGAKSGQVPKPTALMMIAPHVSLESTAGSGSGGKRGGARGGRGGRGGLSAGRGGHSAAAAAAAAAAVAGVPASVVKPPASGAANIQSPGLNMGVELLSLLAAGLQPGSSASPPGQRLPDGTGQAGAKAGIRPMGPASLFPGAIPSLNASSSSLLNTSNGSNSSSSSSSSNSGAAGGGLAAAAPPPGSASNVTPPDLSAAASSLTPSLMPIPTAPAAAGGMKGLTLPNPSPRKNNNLTDTSSAALMAANASNASAMAAAAYASAYPYAYAYPSMMMPVAGGMMTSLTPQMMAGMMGYMTYDPTKSAGSVPTSAGSTSSAASAAAAMSMAMYGGAGRYMLPMPMYTTGGGMTYPFATAATTAAATAAAAGQAAQAAQYAAMTSAFSAPSSARGNAPQANQSGANTASSASSASVAHAPAAPAPAPAPAAASAVQATAPSSSAAPAVADKAGGPINVTAGSKPAVAPVAVPAAAVSSGAAAGEGSSLVTPAHNGSANTGAWTSTSASTQLAEADTLLEMPPVTDPAALKGGLDAVDAAMGQSGLPILAVGEAPGST